MDEKGSGLLYLCATPIGNLEDITYRAVRVMREADLIAAEDTRTTRKLLSRYDIHTPVTSYHAHNHRHKSPYLLDLVEEGKKVVLVSEAGMPGISDPGEALVQEAVKRGVRVVPLPGPNAALAALVVSGLPAGSFIFCGFLPAGRRAKRDQLAELAGEKRTMLFYESPHRLRETLSDMYATFGNRRAALARELTKKYEEVLRACLGELVKYYRHNEPRGEYTLVVAGAGEATELRDEMDPWEGLTPVEHVNRLVDEGLHRKEAIKKVARLRGIPKRELYEQVVKGEQK